MDVQAILQLPDGFPGSRRPTSAPSHGWGPIDSDTDGIGVYPIKSWTLPPGWWSIWAPVRFRFTSHGKLAPWFQFAEIVPEPLELRICDQTNIQQPWTPSGPVSGDFVYPCSLFIVCEAETEVELRIRTRSLNSGQVQDGDPIIFGQAA